MGRKVTKRGIHPYMAYLNDKSWGYERWQESENIPIVRGFHVEDVLDLPLAPWSRMGGYGTFINLADQKADDAFISLIPPGENLKAQRHLYEEVVYVLDGTGTTMLRSSNGDEVQFEWNKGSLFTIPLNIEYQHFNVDGAKDAILLACTDAPLTMELYRSPEFVFDNPFEFSDRFDNVLNRKMGDGTLHLEYEGGLWETDFVPDIRKLSLQDDDRRGKGFKQVYIALAQNVMKVHIAEFEVGTYKKAHRHGPGAHILILEGSGYSLMWNEDDEPVRYDWRPGSLISPPAGMYHQHFNTGDIPVFHLAFHRPQSVGGEGPRDEIEYEDERPEIKAKFESEMQQNGIVSKM